MLGDALQCSQAVLHPQAQRELRTLQPLIGGKGLAQIHDRAICTHILLHQRYHRATGECLPNELVPVGILSGQRHEQRMLSGAARIDDNVRYRMGQQRALGSRTGQGGDHSAQRQHEGSQSSIRRQTMAYLLGRDFHVNHQSLHHPGKSGRCRS